MRVGAGWVGVTTGTAAKVSSVGGTERPGTVGVGIDGKTIEVEGTKRVVVEATSVVVVVVVGRQRGTPATSIVVGEEDGQGNVVVVVSSGVVVVVVVGTQWGTPAASMVVDVDGHGSAVVVVVVVELAHTTDSGQPPAIVVVVVDDGHTVAPATQPPEVVVVVELGQGASAELQGAAEATSSTLRIMLFPESATNRFPVGSIPSPTRSSNVAIPGAPSTFPLEKSLPAKSVTTAPGVTLRIT